MKLSITGALLREKFLENPNWLDSEEVKPYSQIEVTTFANLEGLKIKTLTSKKSETEREMRRDQRVLKFCGLGRREWEGQCASFKNCKLLESAHADFEGNVDFSGSGLTTTKGIFLNPNGVVPSKYVALFEDCKNLLVAEGDWSGPVSYARSSVTEIKDLHIRFPNQSYGEYKEYKTYSAGNTFLQEQKISAANFHGCLDLKIATGEFPGFVDFSNSGVTECQNLVITGTNSNGNSASFENCMFLMEAEGMFEGAVNYSGSNLHKINSQNLIIKNANKEGMAAYFISCNNLIIAEGNYPGGIDYSNSSINDIGVLTTPIGSHILFIACRKLRVAKGHYKGTVNFSESGIEKFDEDNFIIAPMQDLKEPKEPSKPSNSAFTHPIQLIIRNCEKLKELPISVIKQLNSGAMEPLNSRFQDSGLEPIELLTSIIADQQLIKNCLKKMNAIKTIKNSKAMEPTIDI